MRLILTAILFTLFSMQTVSAQSVPPDATAPEAETTVSDDANSLSIETLLAILKDDQARENLISTLEQALSADSADIAVADETATRTPDEPTAIAASITGAVAEKSRAFAEKTVSLVKSVGQLTEDLGEAFTDTSQINYPQLTFLLTQLALAIAVVLGSFIVMRTLTDRFITRLARQAEHQKGWGRRLALLLTSAITELVTVAISWTLGYTIALVFGRVGQMSIYQSLFLNAFLIIEITKVVLRLIFMQSHKSLRLLPIEDTDAAYWYFWCSRISSLLGYGVLFAVPVIASETSQRLGTAAQIIVVFVALLLTIVLILQNKTKVRKILHRRLDHEHNDAFGRFLAFVGKQWHRGLILYMVVFFIVWASEPAEALSFMISASAGSLLAIVIGILATVFISRAIQLGLHLPKSVREALPLLEERLNAFVPTVLKGVRIVIVIGVILSIADAWELLQVAEWLLSDSGQGFIGTIASVFLITAIGTGIYLAMASWVEYRLNPAGGGMPSAREVTLLSLLRNALTIVLFIVMVMMVLSEIGVNIGPLIAGAGVFGLAISFGAQKFVQDVITGVFIQFENAMNTGDVVSVGGVTGVVEKLTIRSVSIRSLDGTLHFIPFSTVDLVSNYVKHFGYHIAAIGVAYRESIPAVKEAMYEAFSRLVAVEDHAKVVRGELEMHGVTEFADSSVVVRARIKTNAGNQWAVGRAYNELIKEVFDERGIEIPFPHVTLYMGEDKNGVSPPLRVISESEEQPKPKPNPIENQQETDLAQQRKGKISPENQDGPAEND